MFSIRRIVIQILLFISLLTLLPTHSYAVDPTPTPRHAECDACGYCIGKTVPESWKSCRACLYPTITDAAGANKTLEIIIAPIPDPNNANKILVNVPLPPARGKYFTQLGCVDTSLSSFSDPGAVGGVLNFLLTKLIFPSTGILAFGALIYGAFLLVTAQGAEMQIASGKRYVTGAIVGLIFTFSVVLIVNIVGGDVLRIPGLNSTNQPTPTPIVSLLGCWGTNMACDAACTSATINTVTAYTNCDNSLCTYTGPLQWLKSNGTTPDFSCSLVSVDEDGSGTKYVYCNGMSPCRDTYSCCVGFNGSAATANGIVKSYNTDGCSLTPNGSYSTFAPKTIDYAFAPSSYEVLTRHTPILGGAQKIPSGPISVYSSGAGCDPTGSGACYKLTSSTSYFTGGSSCGPSAGSCTSSTYYNLYETCTWY